MRPGIIAVITGVNGRFHMVLLVSLCMSLLYFLTILLSSVGTYRCWIELIDRSSKLWRVCLSSGTSLRSQNVEAFASMVEVLRLKYLRMQVRVLILIKHALKAAETWSEYVKSESKVIPRFLGLSLGYAREPSGNIEPIQHIYRGCSNQKIIVRIELEYIIQFWIAEI